MAHCMSTVSQSQVVRSCGGLRAGGPPYRRQCWGNSSRMMLHMDDQQLTKLVSDLSSLDHETEWVEFKENNANPEDIGEYLSAIANSAALARRDRGYIVWGVRDGDHEVVGTMFRPHTDKVKGQELENWLVTHLSPEIHFAIHEGEIDGNPGVVFEVPAAAHTPVRFKDFEYIRVGSYKKKLRDHPEKERDLWAILSGGSFEDAVAHMGASAADIIALLDHTAFFKMLSSQAPPGADAIVQRFVEEELVSPATMVGSTCSTSRPFCSLVISKRSGASGGRRSGS